VDVLARNLPVFLRSFGQTLFYSLATLTAASICGALISMVYILVQRKGVRGALSAIVSFIRGLPLLIILFATYYILPFFGLNLEKVWAGLLGMTIFFAASISEVFRGALESVPAIQVDAAKALGLLKWQRLRYIIFPQATKLIVSPLLDEFVRIIKGTTLLSLLSIHELMLAAREVVTSTFKGMEVYGTVGIMYFLFIYACSRLSHRLEAKLTWKH